MFARDSVQNDCLRQPDVVNILPGIFEDRWKGGSEQQPMTPDWLARRAPAACSKKRFFVEHSITFGTLTLEMCDSTMVLSFLKEKAPAGAWALTLIFEA